VQFNINSDNRQGQTSGQNYENRLTGPMGMGPECKVVVAINDDTIYAEAFVERTPSPSSPSASTSTLRRARTTSTPRTSSGRLTR
jgi:hypothetical protein